MVRLWRVWCRGAQWKLTARHMCVIRTARWWSLLTNAACYPCCVRTPYLAHVAVSVLTVRVQSEVQMGQLHTCPLQLKLMPTTSLSHTLHNEETRDNTFDIFHSQLKTLLLNVYLIWNFSKSVVTCHVHLCIVINHSLSLRQCREHKPPFQIINNWWLKY